MSLFRKINCFFDRLTHDIKLFNPKASLIFGAITLLLGIFSWLAGGRAHRVMVLYMFPRCALSLGFMYFLWGASFVFVGLIMGGVAFGCEKYKRREAIKVITFLALSYVLTLLVYCVFFKFSAPFITFIILLLSEIFCFFALLSSIRINALWSICIVVNLIWLIYNGYLAFAIALIN